MLRLHVGIWVQENKYVTGEDEHFAKQEEIQGRKAPNRKAGILAYISKDLEMSFCFRLDPTRFIETWFSFGIGLIKTD